MRPHPDTEVLSALALKGSMGAEVAGTVGVLNRSVYQINRGRLTGTLYHRPSADKRVPGIL